MAHSFDFYRPPISTDPSLSLLERRGAWAFGGIGVLAVILLVALIVRLDQLGASPRSALEASIWRDWRKNSRELDNLQRRETLPPPLHRSLKIWGAAGASNGMLRLHSIFWSLVLIAVVFRIGATLFAPSTGALAALLLALSPPLVAASQRIAPAPEAAALLALNFALLLRAAFRHARGIHWALYLLTGALAVLCHPLSIWVISVQAILTLMGGGREGRPIYFGRVMSHALLLILFAWMWFRVTAPADLPDVDWGRPMESGFGPLIRLLGVEAFWGARVYPAGVWWTLLSIAVFAVPLVYGGLAIRQRQTQEIAGFLAMAGAAPVAWILLAPHRWIATHLPAADALTLVLAPLALWAAVAIRSGLSRSLRRILAAALLLGGLLVTVWSSRVQVLPEWQSYRGALSDHALRGRPIIADQIERSADYEEYLAWPLGVKTMADLLRTAALPDKSVVVLETTSPLYRRNDPPATAAPFIRAYLRKNCRPRELLSDDFFRLALWTDVQPDALRDFVNRATFFDPDAWETFKFTRWFGPFDPGFDTTGSARNLVHLPESNLVGHRLAGSRTSWKFSPQQLPGYYHVFVPIRMTDSTSWREVALVWTLPSGERKRETVNKETSGFSFIWDAVVPNQPLKIAVSAPSKTEPTEPPPVAVLGVGLRRHFPYVVDFGEPFDDIALGSGWHAPQRDDGVSYRWTDARAHVSFYLPAAGGIGMTGRLSISCACRHPDGPQSVEFEVLWDGQKIADETVAGQEWQTLRLDLPSAPPPGRHEVVIRSPIFSAPDPADPNQRLQLGVMVDKMSVE